MRDKVISVLLVLLGVVFFVLTALYLLDNGLPSYETYGSFKFSNYDKAAFEVIGLVLFLIIAVTLVIYGVFHWYVHVDKDK